MDPLANLRREYTLHGLRQADLHADPVEQLRTWLDQAVAAGLADATAMVLGTAGDSAVPSSRIVLLKGVDEGGLLFFTNYESPKAIELRENPYACLLFFWAALERQVRITGKTEKTSREESEAYFASRPRESQISAWISRQGRVVENRAELEQRQADKEKEFAGREVPCPPFWGGYRLRPEGFEFWQGRSGRLHDRLRYRKHRDGWVIERLCP